MQLLAFVPSRFSLVRNFDEVLEVHPGLVYLRSKLLAAQLLTSDLLMPS